VNSSNEFAISQQNHVVSVTATRQ